MFIHLIRHIYNIWYIHKHAYTHIYKNIGAYQHMPSLSSAFFVFCKVPTLTLSNSSSSPGVIAKNSGMVLMFFCCRACFRRVA